MNNISRRKFLAGSTKGAGLIMAAGWLPAELFAAAKTNKLPLGFQTWTVREMLVKDFAGTLKMMAGMGYQLTEMCSPKGYEHSGFGPLVTMKTSDMRNIITDAGLVCPSCHFGFAEFTDEDNLNDRIEFAHELGLTQMILSSFGLPATASLDDYLRAADKLNKAAEKISAAGLQGGFHNHATEFHELDDQLIYEALMKRLDPKLVKMQFQTQVITLGYKAADYFRKYPGRFISAHLSDWTADKKEMPIGNGVIDWKEFFAAAKTGGVQNFFVEMALSTFQPSVAYIHSIDMA